MPASLYLVAADAHELAARYGRSHGFFHGVIKLILIAIVVLIILGVVAGVLLSRAFSRRRNGPGAGAWNSERGPRGRR